MHFIRVGYLIIIYEKQSDNVRSKYIFEQYYGSLPFKDVVKYQSPINQKQVFKYLTNKHNHTIASITAPRVYVLYRYVCVGIGVDLSFFDVHLKVLKYIIYLVGFYLLFIKSNERKSEQAHIPHAPTLLDNAVYNEWQFQALLTGNRTKKEI